MIYGKWGGIESWAEVGQKQCKGFAKVVVNLIQNSSRNTTTTAMKTTTPPPPSHLPILCAIILSLRASMLSSLLLLLLLALLLLRPSYVLIIKWREIVHKWLCRWRYWRWWGWQWWWCGASLAPAQATTTTVYFWYSETWMSETTYRFSEINLLCRLKSYPSAWDLNKRDYLRVMWLIEMLVKFQITFNFI